MPVDSAQVSERVEPTKAIERPPGSARPSARDTDFLKHINQAVRVTERRLRMGHALARAVRFAPWIFGGLVPVAVLGRLALPGSFAPALLLGVTVFVALVARAYLRGPQARDAARALDRSHALFDGVTTTLEMQDRLTRGETLDGYWWLALDRLGQSMPSLDPRGASAWSPPRGWGWALGSLATLLALATVNLGGTTTEPAAVPPRPAAPAAALFSSEELELAALEAERLALRMTSPAGQKATSGFNRAAAEVLRETDKSEAFRRLLELEAELRASELDLEQLARELKDRGAALSQATLSRPSGAALEAGLQEDAAVALRQLAERLEDKREKLTDKELEQLRNALEAAAQKRAEKAQREAEAAGEQAGARERLEQRKRLLEEKQKAGQALDDKDKAELARTERELARLERHKREREESLSALDRELADAARALEQERQKAGNFREQAAEHVKQAAERVEEAAAKKLTDEEKKQLLERMKQLKEQLRQRREEGGSQGEAQRNFERRARGQATEGEGQDGGEPGSEPPGPAGRQVQIPGAGQSKGVGVGDPSGERAPSGASPGSEPGTSHEPEVAGAATPGLADDKVDVAAVAQDTGQGATASETIQMAAKRGFTRPGYEAVYRDYETVAEEAMTKENIPPGYRRHIERYFQLIRPRAQKERP